MKDEMISATKAELMRLMKRRGGITIKEASTSLDLAPSTIRQHLSGLEVEGFVEKRIKRQGAGRPSKLYSLTDKAGFFFTNRENSVLGQLLRFLIESGDRQKLEEFFSTSCDESVKTWKQKVAGDTDEQVIAQVKGLFEELGYIPEVSQDAEGRRVIEFFHCPYPTVVAVEDYPCQCERRFLEKMTGEQLVQVCSMRKGEGCCRFLAVKSDE